MSQVSQIVRLVVVFCLSLSVFSRSSESAYAQDPTVPSPQILERLQQPSEPVAVPQALAPMTEKEEPLPIVKLKAMVMRDPDNGIALVEMNGRRTRLRLSRVPTNRTESNGVLQNAEKISEEMSEEGADKTSVAGQEQAAAPGVDEDTLAGIAIHGTMYFVESFSPRSILLNGRGHKLLVQ